MLYAIDTEFIEDGKTIDLLSIGCVAEDGRTYYGQNLDCDFMRASPWVQEHVYPHLEGFRWTADDAVVTHPWQLTMDAVWKTPQTLAAELKQFVGEDPCFLGYYCAYDWVALCQLFGTMIQIPCTWPMYCVDLRQWLDQCQCSDITQSDDMPHHALSDARWILKTWEQGHGIWR